MVVAYWVLAGLLGMFFVYSGGIKVIRTLEALRPMMAWVGSVPPVLVRTIGVLEVLGALGLVLPPLVRVVPGLALAAAVGLLVVQLGGIVLHLRRGEARVIGLNVVLVALLSATAWLSSTVV